MKLKRGPSFRPLIDVDSGLAFVAGLAIGILGLLIVQALPAVH